MDFEITEGVINGAQKVVFYGPEGIGKTTFASKFPDPLFIDTEGSTKKIKCKEITKAYKLANADCRSSISHSKKIL